MAYRIGIDVGSKTVKIIVLDEDGKTVFSTYVRHRADVKHTLSEAVHNLLWHRGDFEASVAVTGSAGIQLAALLGVPFVQEVIATTHAVQDAFPQADAVIELGGEDAKVIYLTGGLEQRMNATCAGGTGGFIDTIAFMLGVRPAEMSRLAHGARTIYPIASRCAVFAQTDVRPLLSSGASKADIAASVFDAVVRQTIGGLACGRPIRGTVVFLGGPLEHLPYLVHRFRDTLGLDARTGIKPKDAHLVTARGAALLAERAGGAVRGEANAAGIPTTSGVDTPAGSLTVNAADAMGATDEANATSMGNLASAAMTMRVSLLERRLQALPNFEDDLGHLPPLFESQQDVELFRARHGACALPTRRFFDARGPLYVGIDAGSTTVKLAVLDSSCTLVHSAYEPTRGDVLKTVGAMLTEMYSAMPRPYSKNESPYVWVEHATATGYGEDLLRAAFRVDSGVVETAAHLRAAQHLCPEVSFVLDIGGQDMKALWVRGGQVSDAVLNEACSSGCGAFVEGTAYSLRSNPWEFANAALLAKAPVDLGTKCTVFMTSRVRHAQKIGAELGDIAAGVAYSVVQNALYRIIGADRVASMGPHVVVQGGTFKSDAVLRAFELVCGVEALRCKQSHLMGAVGAALVAAERGDCEHVGCAKCGHAERTGYDDMGEQDELEGHVGPSEIGKSDGERPPGHMQANGSTDKPAGREGEHVRSASSLLSREEIEALAPQRRSLTCSGCVNSCTLSVVSFGDNRSLISGNKCDRGLCELDRRKEGKDACHAAESSAPRIAPGSADNGAPAEMSCAGSGARSAALGGRTLDAPSADAGTAAENAPRANSGSLASRTHTHAHTTTPPNMIALEQQLIRAFGDAPREGQRGQLAVGLMNTLENYELTPFWHTLLTELGLSVVVPAAGCEQARSNEAWETVPSESVCYAAKISHARYFSLKDKGAQVVLVPQFERESHCPVSAGYARALADNIEDARAVAAKGNSSLVTPKLSSYKPERFLSDEGSRRTLFDALAKCVERTGDALGEDEFTRALAAAASAQRSFCAQLEEATARTLAWVEEDPSRHAVLLAGRPYHADAALVHGIDLELGKLGFAVLGILGLSPTLRAQHHRSQYEGAYPWKPAKRLMRAAHFAAEHEQVDLVCLHSFGCGFDALSVEETRTVLEVAGRPHTVLKVDDISDVAHLRIRLRTLAEAVESKKRRGPRGGRAFACPSPTSSELSQAKRAQKAHLLANGMCDEDLETARRDTVGDVCFTANVMAARAIRLLREDPDLGTIVLPHVCKACLTDAVPRMVERATGRTPTYEWEDVWPSTGKQHEHASCAQGAREQALRTQGACESCAQGDCEQVLREREACTQEPHRQEAREQAPRERQTCPQDALTERDYPKDEKPLREGGSADESKPLVGVLGNALLCFDAYMNDGLVDMLDALGCTPALPDPALLAVEDVRYLDQLAAFEQAGVRDVIYLQSFGCLKGHVQSRGALHQLAARFPDIRITVIDYDPEASALNRENRVRLAAEAARQGRALRKSLRSQPCRRDTMASNTARAHAPAASIEESARP